MWLTSNWRICLFTQFTALIVVLILFKQKLFWAWQTDFINKAALVVSDCDCDRCAKDVLAVLCFFRPMSVNFSFIIGYQTNKQANRQTNSCQRHSLFMSTSLRKPLLDCSLLLPWRAAYLPGVCLYAGISLKLAIGASKSNTLGCCVAICLVQSCCIE